MKKVISLILILQFVIITAGCSVIPDEEVKKDTSSVSAVWMYYSEISMQDKNGGTEKQFRDKTEEMFRNCADRGINTVFYHVRPFSDAFYKSEVFPWSKYLTGTQGVEPDYDPLEIVIEIAHSYNISLHAWINPFRILASDDYSSLSSDNPALKWINENSPNVVNVNNGWYFSPGSSEAQKLIVDGVREIAENYDVDGIHIDDYFYPSTDESVDAVFYKEYKDNGGELSLKNWRLNTVSAFVSQLYGATKSKTSKCIFSISPAGNILNNYNEQFADVKLWMSERGYADWIIPQLYYGFDNEILSFGLALEAWSALKKSGDVKLIYGIAAYKVNESDDEWQSGNGIIDKQLDLIIKKENCGGAAFFSYSCLVDPDKAAEFVNIKQKLFAEAPAE